MSIHDDVKVTICCNTFNHAPYIEDAIEGFLMQEADFGYEIYIHDDASTDGTREILEKYRDAHPNIIRLFLEEENQFGKGKYGPGGYVGGLMTPLAHGEYIAVCEGDDYWTDASKLQSQVDYLEAHPTCSMAAHDALVVDGRTKNLLGHLGMGNSPRCLTPADIIRDWQLATASFLYRKENIAEYVEKWSFKKPVGDYPIAVYNGTKGHVYYDPRPMSVYRFQIPGSWTERQKQQRPEAGAIDWLEMNESIDKITQQRWHSELVHASQRLARILLSAKSWPRGATPFQSEVRKSLRASDWGKIWMKRIIFSAGFDVTIDGWGGQRRRRLKRRNHG